MREIYFHEDDYCQIEIIPNANLSFCSEELNNITSFSDEHKEDLGWNDVYIRKNNPSKLKDLNINLEDLRNSLIKKLPEYDLVYTGYSSYKEKCSFTYAFGKDDSDALFVEVDETNTITAMWCSDPMKELLNLPYIDKLLLVDWPWNFACPLSDSNKIIGYIDERNRTIEENYRVSYPDLGRQKDLR